MLDLVPQPGIKPRPLPLRHWVLATGPPGTSQAALVLFPRKWYGSSAPISLKTHTISEYFLLLVAMIWHFMLWKLLVLCTLEMSLGILLRVFLRLTSEIGLAGMPGRINHLHLPFQKSTLYCSPSVSHFWRHGTAFPELHALPPLPSQPLSFPSCFLSPWFCK